MEDSPSIIIECECRGDAIQVEFEPEDNQFYFSLWHQGFYNNHLSWWERLRWTWRILTTGNPWTDLVILSPEKAGEIKDFIEKHLPTDEPDTISVEDAINEVVKLIGKIKIPNAVEILAAMQAMEEESLNMIEELTEELNNE